MSGTVLAVDDEAFNLDILTELLEDDGYDVVGAVDGLDAWEKLQAGLVPDVIVLDRMMPRMDGMSFLARVRDDARHNRTPVIMQTAAASHDQIRQGIEAGVFYYLTKPYEEQVLLSLVRAALEDGRHRSHLLDEVRRHQRVLGLLTEGSFRFRTLDDAQALSIFISNAFPDPERVVYGLSELMINAVEHGNLGITYEEKSRLVQQGRWLDEVETRLSRPGEAGRYATLTFRARDGGYEACIADLGGGFDWQAYLDLSPDRATDAHGRGIATAKLIAFDEITYNETGNVVTAAILSPKK